MSIVPATHSRQPLQPHSSAADAVCSGLLQRELVDIVVGGLLLKQLKSLRFDRV